MSRVVGGEGGLQQGRAADGEVHADEGRDVPVQVREVLRDGTLGDEGADRRYGVAPASYGAAPALYGAAPATLSSRGAQPGGTPF